MRAYGRIVGRAWARFNEHGEGRGHRRVPRVSFEGRYLTSYRTIVAGYRTATDGSQYVLVTSRNYSLSTNSHIRNCVDWCSVPVFTVPEIHDATADAQAANFKHLWQRVLDIAEDAKKRWNPDRGYSANHLATHWQAHLTAAFDHARAYADA